MAVFEEDTKRLINNCITRFPILKPIISNGNPEIALPSIVHEKKPRIINAPPVKHTRDLEIILITYPLL